MVEFAKQKVREKQIENMTETGEYILVQTLLKIVEEDRYYKVKEIRDLMATYFDEEQKWLTTAWVGRALRRLGFTEKRRVGTGYEYLIKTQAVQDLAERLGIKLQPESQTQTSRNLSFNDLLPELRRRLQADFTEADFTVIAKQLGLSETEAKNLFVRLRDEGCLAVTPYGLWKWIK